jgi:hypothetical protein
MVSIFNTNPSFDWLRQECLQIKSQRFHIFEPRGSADYCYEVKGHCIELRGDYVDFLREFGWAKFFTDYNDAPVISVYPLKEYRRHKCKDGKTYVGFGDRGNKSFCFEEDEVLSGSPSKVYMLNGNRVDEPHQNFPDWLKTSYELVKSKYTQSKWQKLVAGPKPFSPEEIQVVEARRNFAWKLVGFSEDGSANFEVKNNSIRTLPYLSIGIQGKGGRILVGAVWLNVGHIQPGEKAVVTKDCYKDRISRDELEPFDLPEPIPEKKDRYWEFGAPR